MPKSIYSGFRYKYYFKLLFYEASGIGLALMWIPPQYEGEIAFVAKWLNEFDTENRLEGDHVFLSFMMSL